MRRVSLSLSLFSVVSETQNFVEKKHKIKIYYYALNFKIKSGPKNLDMKNKTFPMKTAFAPKQTASANFFQCLIHHYLSNLYFIKTNAKYIVTIAHIFLR